MDGNPWAVENVEAFHYYCCPECEQRYTESQEFQDHALKVHPKAKALFDTDIDDNVSKEDLEDDQETDPVDSIDSPNPSESLHLPKTDFSTLKCLNCSKSFKSLLKLSTHLHQIHNVSQCPKCHKIFTSFDLLKSHIQTEHKPLKICSICQAQVKNLSIHIRTQHTNDNSMKVFKCSECDFGTHSQKNLTQHIFIRHRKDEHKFECNECDKKFPTSFLFKQHVEISHKGLNKRHVCEKCGKAFAYKNGIKDHPCRPGHVQKDVQCDKCDSVFTREMDYLQHHKTQHGGFPPHLEHRVKYLCEQVRQCGITVWLLQIQPK